MTFDLHNIAEGFSRSFLDNTMYEVKKNLTSDKPATSIDHFFEPLVTALLDAIQMQSIQKRGIATFSKGLVFKKVPTLLSNQTFIAFLLAKTALNVTASLARGAIRTETRQTLKKIHDGMESILPLTSVVIVIASMNLAYISAYFLYLGVNYLGTHNSTSNDMGNICRYSSTILGISSLLYLKSPNSLIF